MPYAELVCQSNFSFLTGASSPEQLVDAASALGYQALALTDECSVAGVVRAHRQIKQQQLPLKLIIGSLFRADNHLQLVLLCPDRSAYAELCRIITNCRRRADKGQYQLELWDLKSCRHCLVLWLPSGQTGPDQHWAAWLSRQFGARLSLAQQRRLNHADLSYQQHCQQLAQQFNLNCCAVGAVLMHQAAQLPLLDVLTAIRLGCTVQQAGSALASNAERALRPLPKLAHLFSAGLLANSCQLASRCQFNLDSLRYEYPAELVPPTLTAMQYLRQQVAAGALLRFDGPAPAAIQQMIEQELSLIDELDYAYYFLTIADIVQFARRQHILYQGRGSAANSVVCYCLQITAVDPRQISMLFERFISRERAEPPDIDVDFEHERREEVIQYIYQKYGRQRAALAATVISYRFRSSFRDVGKALGFPLTQLEYFIRQLNRRDPTQSWPQQLAKLGLDLQSIQAQQLIRLVEQIRGFPRHLSQHVGGFVIAAGPLYELVPVENAAMADRTVIQWDKDDLETLGLLKVDILALGMLTALRKTFTLIQQQHQRNVSLPQISALGDDPAVYQQIQQADTIGVFQIESRAQMSMLPRLKPRCFYDLVIEIAIVRPGPIQGDMVHPYLRRRAGLEKITYPSSAVEAVLSRTLGVPIFQEQVIKLAMVAAGFSGGEADQLRRAMASWKKTGQLAQFKPKLLSGMQQRGYPLAFASRLFEQICGFGEYGFPESHSASFALLAYASAWCKHYYPLEFFCALLNSLPMGFYSPSQLVQDAKCHQLTVLPVCIQHSQWDHQIETLDRQRALRLGLRQIKGLAKANIDSMLQQRPAGGFVSISQLKQSGLPQHELAALASSDALQALSGHRFQSRWQLLDQLNDLPLFATAFAQPSEHHSSSAGDAQHPLAALGPAAQYVAESSAATYQTAETNAREPNSIKNKTIASSVIESSVIESSVIESSVIESSVIASSAGTNMPLANHRKLKNPKANPATTSQYNAPALLQQLLAPRPAQPAGSGPDVACPLPPPSALQQLQEDYQSLGLSLQHHPLQLLRAQGALAKVQTALDLTALPDRSLVRVAGLVTVRQSPGTASGVTFVTLEDETGSINLIVWQATALAQKQPFLTARLLQVHGILQRAENVIHIVAGRLISLDHLLPELGNRSRDFH